MRDFVTILFCVLLGNVTAAISLPSHCSHYQYAVVMILGSIFNMLCLATLGRQEATR
jgi:hypothetical protein